MLLIKQLIEVNPVFDSSQLATMDDAVYVKVQLLLLHLFELLKDDAA